MKPNYFLLLIALQVLVFSAPLIAMAEVVQISAIVSGCGDGIIEAGEQCDGANLGAASCASNGFSGGTLSCNSNCTINTSSCVISAPPAPPSGGGGGGGGGVYIPPSTSTGVIFSGHAYPLSTITLLKDGQVVASTVAGADATFSITVTGLSTGNYLFSLYGEDNNGVRSDLSTFPVSVTTGVVTNVGGIFISPTISVDKSEVKQGDNIAIFGQSAPSSTVTIIINSDSQIMKSVSADKSGIYLYNFDTTPLELGSHTTKSKASLNGQITAYSYAVGFEIGDQSILASDKNAKFMKGDLNNDDKVNLIDFSIAAYWYHRTLSDSFKVIEAQRLNGDGKIDLTDLSIIAYYWTG